MLDPFPDAVDLVVGLDAVLGPCGVKLELLPFLLGRTDRHEAGAGAASLDGLVGDPLVREPPMPGGFSIRGIQNGMLNDAVRHALLPGCH
jgi:hypothetical protein